MQSATDGSSVRNGITFSLSTNVRILSLATVRSNSAYASSSVANKPSQTMDVFLAARTFQALPAAANVAGLGGFQASSERKGEKSD